MQTLQIQKLEDSGNKKSFTIDGSRYVETRDSIGDEVIFRDINIRFG